MSIIRTLIGNGERGLANDGVINADTPIDEPFDVTFSPDGLLYCCAVGNHTIRAIDLERGTVRTIAGIPGEIGNDGDGGPATAALLNEPYEIRFDPRGNLVFVDMKNHVIRRIDAESGVIETVAGTGAAGFGGDGGPAAQAAFSQPHSIETLADGAIWIADIGNHRLREIDASGTIRTIGGDGSQAATINAGKLDETPLNGPRTMAIDPDGTVFLVLREGNQIYRIDRDRTIHLIAGTGEFGYSGDGGPALDAKLSGPKGIAVNAQTIYFADTESHTIRSIDRRTGIIATVVGDGTRHDGDDGDDGDPLRCGLARPHGVAVSARGLFIGDSENHRVRWLAFD